MRGQIVLRLVLVVVWGVVCCLAALDDDKQACLGQYKAAIKRVELPSDVLEFIKTEDASGATPDGCQQVYRLSEQLLDEVPCANELIYMDEDILDDLNSDPQARQFYQAATSCALSEFGAFNQGHLNYEDEEEAESHQQ